jgi:4a-hydroxytetrahydrobiopterin dehydratase
MHLTIRPGKNHVPVSNLEVRAHSILPIIIMWKEEDNKLQRSFQFKDFKQAIAFMNEVALVADELNHHPWWSNVYNKVEIELTTHDAGNTVTELDHKLATRIDAIYEKVMR